MTTSALSDREEMVIREAFRAAVASHQAGRLPEAEALYRKILSERPNHPEALQLLGVLASQLDRHDVALDLIRRAVDLRPTDATFLVNLGDVARRCGRIEEALSACRRALELDPENAGALHNLGNVFAEQKHFNEAIAAYQKAIALAPRQARSYDSLGNALRAIGQLNEAIRAYRAALEMAPDDALAMNNLGGVLFESGFADESIVACRRAIELQPKLAQTHNTLGVALLKKGRLDEAASALREAVRLDPGYALAYSNLGNCLRDAALHDLAIEAYARAVELDPRAAELHSNLVYALHFCFKSDGASVLSEARRWDRQHATPLAVCIHPHENEDLPERRLRIGYVSPDFCDHVVGRNFLPLLEEHDASQFEVHCYSDVLVPDHLTDRFQSITPHWHDIAGKSDQEVSELVRKDQIDILVDLAVHTARNRLLVFARKPAPIQITHLGYCGTTGMATMDFRLSDPFIDAPEAADECYSERTLRLPHCTWCYQPAGATPEVTPLPAGKRGFVTFASRNNFAKVSTEALDCWLRILSVVENSRLLLFAPEGSCRERVLARAKGHGVEEDRLEFVGRQPWEDFVETYARVDLALDTFPYSGWITTCDALWLGVPVITLSGKTSVGRGGRSILSNIGLPELVAESTENYVELAVSLARDLPRLATLRSELRERMERSPLRDPQSFARDVEAAYRQVWRDWCRSRI